MAIQSDSVSSDSILEDQVPPRHEKSTSTGNLRNWDVSKCVYCGNIPLDVDEATLTEFIHSQVGSDRLQSVKLIVDRSTGSSKGYSYLNFKEAEDAQRAVDQLSSVEFRGNPLTVTPRIVRSVEQKRREAFQRQRVYIANLAWSISEADLIQLIEEKLGVKDVVNYAKIGKDALGRSKGFAHVELKDYNLIDTLKEKLNGYDAGFKPLFVERATATGERKATSGVRSNDSNESRGDRRAVSRGASGRSSPRVSIFVGNLSWGVTPELLEEMLTDVLGENSYIEARLARDPSSGNHRGFAHVDFRDEATAERAIQELNGMELLSRVLRANRADNRSRPNKPSREESAPAELSEE